MADLGQTDFSFKPDVNIAAIASLYQKQKADQQQMALQQQQIESQKQDRVLQMFDMASKMTQGLIQNSRDSHLASIVGAANQMNPQPTDETGTATIHGMVPAQSSLFPQLKEAPGLQTVNVAKTQDVPLSASPDYQAQLKEATISANPTASSEQLSKQLFQDPQMALLAKQGKLADLQIKEQTIANNANEADPNSDTSKLVREQVSKQLGKPLPETMTAKQLKPISDAISKGDMASARMLMAQAVGARTELSAIQSGPGAVEQNKVQQAIHIKGLAEQYHDPKTGNYNIPVTVYPELVLGLARLTSPNGQVGVELEKEFKQVTTKGKLAQLYVRLTGDTSTDLANASTQDVLKVYIDSINRQGEIAEENRNNALGTAQTVMGKEVDPSVAKTSYTKYRDRLDNLYKSKTQSNGVSLPGGFSYTVE